MSTWRYSTTLTGNDISNLIVSVDRRRLDVHRLIDIDCLDVDNVRWLHAVKSPMCTFMVFDMHEGPMLVCRLDDTGAAVLPVSVAKQSRRQPSVISCMIDVDSNDVIVSMADRRVIVSSDLTAVQCRKIDDVCGKDASNDDQWCVGYGIDTKDGIKIAKYDTKSPMPADITQINIDYISDIIDSRFHTVEGDTRLRIYYTDYRGCRSVADIRSDGKPASILAMMNNEYCISLDDECMFIRLKPDGLHEMLVCGDGYECIKTRAVDYRPRWKSNLDQGLVMAEDDTIRTIDRQIGDIRIKDMYIARSEHSHVPHILALTLSTGTVSIWHAYKWQLTNIIDIQSTGKIKVGLADIDTKRQRYWQVDTD